nr:hypothetical protein BaRGS_034855 [Batillaria attramentaria]
MIIITVVVLTFIVVIIIIIIEGTRPIIIIITIIIIVVVVIIIIVVVVIVVVVVVIIVVVGFIILTHPLPDDMENEFNNEWLVTVLFNYTTGDEMPEGDPNFDAEAMLNSLHDDLYRHKEPFIIVLIVIYILNFVVGLVGNVFVILVILRHRHMRTLTNVFFVNLTVGDLMVVCICLPITLGNYIYKNWVYGSVMCKLTPFLQGTAVGVSVLSMMSISINRYFAIHKPLKAKIVFSRGKVGVMLVAIWLVSIAAVSPFLIINSVTSFGLKGVFEMSACEEKWGSKEARQTYNLVIFCLLFVLPLLIMAVLYTRISLALFADDAHLFETNSTTGKYVASGQAQRVLKQRRKTVRSLILLVVLFGVSWLPYYVVNIWMDFQAPKEPKVVPVFNFIYPLVQVNIT